MTDKEGRKELDDLTTRLKHARGEGKVSPSRSSGDHGAMAMAMRMATELVLAVVIGGAIGWLIDGWIDTRPWLLILFLLLGFAAGLKNVFRVAAKTGAPVADADKDDETQGEETDQRR